MTEGFEELEVTDRPRPPTKYTERSPGATGSEVTVTSAVPSTPSH